MSDESSLISESINQATNETTDLVFKSVTHKNFSKFGTYNIKNYDECEKNGQTILQYICSRSDKQMDRKILDSVLSHANPNQIGSKHSQSLLELSCKKTSPKIFKLILQHKVTSVITQEEFHSLVQLCGNGKNKELFAAILESDKLDVNCKHEKTGNTPLHYAVMASNTNAITKLLNRGASLLTKNEKGQTPLNCISLKQLEGYLDSCIKPDNYATDIYSINYKILLRFKVLITTDSVGADFPEENDLEANVNISTEPQTERKCCGEMGLIHELTKDSLLQVLLKHPLIHIFVYLKWYKCRRFFYSFVIYQAIVFGLMFVLFYNYNTLTTPLLGLCVFTVLLNTAVKLIILVQSWKSKSVGWTVVRPESSMYLLSEMLVIMCTFLTITLPKSSIGDQIRAFVFVQMSVCFLLSLGYHLKLSKWSMMLQTVMKTFFHLAAFFSLLLLGFSAGFQILFEHKNLLSSFFLSTVMTTGELNATDVFGGTEHFGHYFLFFMFTTCICLVIVNFWTGVAVSDIERIEKDSEIIAYRNLVAFLLFVEWFQFKIDISGWNFIKQMIRKYLHMPFVFSTKCDGESRGESGPQFCVGIHINNRDKHFKNQSDFPKKIDAIYLDRLKQHQVKMVHEQSVEEMATKLTQKIETLRVDNKKQHEKLMAKGKKTEELLHTLTTKVEELIAVINATQPKED